MSRLKSRNIRMDNQLWKIIDDFAIERRLTKSDVIRIAVLEYLRDKIAKELKQNEKNTTND